ncbi:LytTR family DNA-binding domain-containing protein [Hansschlegelia quercus]|nr:LytTR family DNA-binding domain-containing protein [Hansschlegelia quercus]
MREFADFQLDAWLRERSAEICLALGLGLIFAFFGPYRTYEQAFLARLGFWAGLLACWYVLASLIEAALDKRAFYRRAGPWLQRAMLIALTSAPMVLIAGPAAHALTGWEASVSEVVELYWRTALVGCVVTLITKGALTPATGRAPAFAPAAEDAALALESPAERFEAVQPEPPQASRLIARLPLELRGRLICLQMEDHYVRVHTDRGSALLLMRLSDAMSEAEPISGMQIHRSWWVANDAIKSFDRVGRTGQLSLSNGVTAPVSQRHLAAVTEAAP